MLLEIYKGADFDNELKADGLDLPSYEIAKHTLAYLQYIIIDDTTSNERYLKVDRDIIVVH